MAGPAFTVVPSGGLPVRQVTSGAPQMTFKASGGIAVTISDRGAPFVLQGYNGGGVTKPVLTWTSGSAAYDPSFNMTQIAENDVAELQIDNNSDFSSPYGTGTNTIDATEAGAGSLTFSGIPTLAAGTTYYARSRYTRGGSVSDWSDTVSKAMDAAPVAPVNTVAPVVSGTATQGQTLSTTNGTWSNSPTGYTYQWQADGVNIGGATANTFLLTATQVGAVVRCVVTATNAGGSTSANSNATAPVAAAAAGVSFTPSSTGVPAQVDKAFASASHSFTGVDIVTGLAIIATYSSGRPVTGVTIDGVAATLVLGSSSGTTDRHVSLWKLAVGSSGTKTVTMTAAANFSVVGIIAGSLIGANAAQTSTALKGPTATANPQVTTSALTVPANGLGLCVMGGGSVFPGWINGTEVAEVAAGAMHSLATFPAGFNAAPSANAGANATIPMVAAAWGP